MGVSSIRTKATVLEYKKCVVQFRCDFNLFETGDLRKKRIDFEEDFSVIYTTRNYGENILLEEKRPNEAQKEEKEKEEKGMEDVTN